RGWLLATKHRMFSQHHTHVVLRQPFKFHQGLRQECTVGLFGLFLQKSHSQTGHRRRFEETTERQVDLEPTAYPRHDLCRQQRVAPQGKEVVLNAYTLKSQEFTP